MSVNEKMTALADGIRTLNGATGILSIDGMTTEVNAANTTITDQADLIAQISTALEGKAAGGGTTIDTCTVTVDCFSTTAWSYCYTAFENGAFTGKCNTDSYNGVGVNSLTFENVVCGSVIALIHTGSLAGASTIDDCITTMAFGNGDIFLNAPADAGVTATVTLYAD